MTEMTINQHKVRQLHQLHALYVTDAEVKVPLGNGKILFHKSCTKPIRRSLLQTGFPCSIYDLK